MRDITLMTLIMRNLTNLFRRPPSVLAGELADGGAVEPFGLASAARPLARCEPGQVTGNRWRAGMNRAPGSVVHPGSCSISRADGPDVFLHYSEIDGYGFRCLKNQHVEFEVTETWGPAGHPRPRRLSQGRPSSLSDNR